MCCFDLHKTSGVYGVSKAALFGLTKVLSVELAPHKVRVNCLAPGLIKTKFGQVVCQNFVKGSVNSCTKGSDHTTNIPFQTAV